MLGAVYCYIPFPETILPAKGFPDPIQANVVYSLLYSLS